MITATIKQIETKLVRNRVDCNFIVYPCLLGKRQQTGNIGTLFSWLADNSIKHSAQRRRRVYSKNPDTVLRFYEKHIKPELVRIDSYIRVLSLYRESGLIPKKVARRHSVLVQKYWGKSYRATKEGLNYISKLSGRYIEKFAKCPHCREKGFSETICGWTCDSCKSLWYNVEPRAGKWISEENPGE